MKRVVKESDDWALYHFDSSKDLPSLELGSVMLLWTDPPYGTGRVQSQGGLSYKDNHETGYVVKAIESWLPFMHEDGVVVVCCDYRLAYKIIYMMTEANNWAYRGEIVWEFGLGRARDSWWPNRHNNILTFTRTESSGNFNKEAMPRAKRLSPKKGYDGDKASGSVWEYTMSNTAPERVGYPNQKPESVITPFILAHTSEGDIVADPFCGSSSTGVCALKHGRRYIGCDINISAINISTERLQEVKVLV